MLNFSDKCLKNWYSLAGPCITRRAFGDNLRVPAACLSGEFATISGGSPVLNHATALFGEWRGKILRA
jgi:hypothetical protein